MADVNDILKFWLDDIGPSGWYNPPQGLDDLIRDKFAQTWRETLQGGNGLWLTYPTGTLAHIILMDQFPRNMFRGSPAAFDGDKRALAAAKTAIRLKWDLRINEPARQFFYLPLMHSESLCDQDRAVRLILTRMPEGAANRLVHARAHREEIRKFGRFPGRNAALSRADTPAESAYLTDGGYGETLRHLAAA